MVYLGTELVQLTTALEGSGGGGGPAKWGQITGNIENQEDLQGALDSKVSKSGNSKITGQLSVNFENFYDSSASVLSGLLRDLNDPRWLRIAVRVNEIIRYQDLDIELINTDTDTAFAVVLKVNELSEHYDLDPLEDPTFNQIAARLNEITSTQKTVNASLDRRIDVLELDMDDCIKFCDRTSNELSNYMSTVDYEIDSRKFARLSALDDYAKLSALDEYAKLTDLDDYAKLSAIPTVNNPTITIKQGTTTKGTFTLNQSGNATITLDAGGSGSSYVTGGWTAKNQNVATNVTVPQGTTSYSLSSYLPADGYKYEVMGLCRYGTTTTYRRSVYGDACQSVNANRDETGATNIRFNIVVGANRLIYVGSASGSIFNTYIELGAYRRLEQY